MNVLDAETRTSKSDEAPTTNLDPRYLVADACTLFFIGRAADDKSRLSVYKSDGTSAGTSVIAADANYGTFCQQGACAKLYLSGRNDGVAWLSATDNTGFVPGNADDYDYDMELLAANAVTDHAQFYVYDDSSRDASNNWIAGYWKFHGETYGLFENHESILGEAIYKFDEFTGAFEAVSLPDGKGGEVTTLMRGMYEIMGDTMYYLLSDEFKGTLENDGGAVWLVKYDGTIATVIKEFGIYKGAHGQGTSQELLVAAPGLGKLFFYATEDGSRSDGRHGVVYETDGTPQGTKAVTVDSSIASSLKLNNPDGLTYVESINAMVVRVTEAAEPAVDDTDKYKREYYVHYADSKLVVFH